jgi:hypothetical protein
MEIGEFIRVAFGSGAEQTLRAARHLQPGDQLRLKVIEVQEDHRVLVDFGKFRAVAEVSFPVRVGDEMCVNVVDTQGQLRLQLVRPADAESAATSWHGPIRPLSSDVLSRLYVQLERILESAVRGGPARLRPDAAATILEGLGQALEPLPSETGSEQVASKVRAWCEDCGLFFEKHLETALAHENTERPIGEASRALERPDIQRILTADLKARLGALKHLLTNQLAEHPELRANAAAELTRSVDELLREISHQLEQAVAFHKNPDAFQVIHFCLPMRDGRTKAQLKISYPKQRAVRAKDGHRAALLLDFDRLGPTRVDLFLLDPVLSMTFFVESEKARQILERHRGDLCAAIAPWFEHLHLTVAVSRRKIAGFETEDLRPASRRRLDVHA